MVRKICSGTHKAIVKVGQWCNLRYKTKYRIILNSTVKFGIFWHVSHRQFNTTDYMKAQVSSENIFNFSYGLTTTNVNDVVRGVYTPVPFTSS